MSPGSTTEVCGDELAKKASAHNSPENVSEKETETPETIVEAYEKLNLGRDISNVFTGSTSVDDGEKKEGDQRNKTSQEKEMVETTAEEMTKSSNGVVAGNGDFEVVSNINNGGGGKTTSILKPSPSVGMSLENLVEVSNVASGKNGGTENASATAMMDEAWDLLAQSYVCFKGQHVGTLAAVDNSAEALNYNQVYVTVYVICFY